MNISVKRRSMDKKVLVNTIFEQIVGAMDLTGATADELLRGYSFSDIIEWYYNTDYSLDEIFDRIANS